jgi:hypothetical protein
MPLSRRSQHPSFLENQQEIEADWDSTFGDRKVELVFIGQNLDEAQIRKDLTACQIPAAQLPEDWKRGWADSWPVERASPL